MKKIQKNWFFQKSKKRNLPIFKHFVLLCFWYYHLCISNAKPEFTGVKTLSALFVVRFTRFWLFFIFSIFTIFTFLIFLVFWDFFQIKRTWKSQVLLACFDIVFSYYKTLYSVVCITIYYYSDIAVNDNDKLLTQVPEWSSWPYSLDVNATMNGKSPTAFLIAT